MAGAALCRRFGSALVEAADAVRLSSETGLLAVDGTWFLERQKALKTPLQLFEEARLPRASHFDIDALGDTSQGLPHMLPTVSSMQAFASQAGIRSLDDPVLVYVHPFSFNAPRVWWTFNAFGFTNVAVLQGGIEAWRSAGGLLDPNPRVEPTPVPSIALALQEHWVVRLAGMQQHVASKQYRMMDTRSLRSHTAGHIAGTLNVSYESLLEENWAYLRSREELLKVFDAHGLDTSATNVVSCGSGVSACVFVLAAHLLGAPLERLPVYDGSFAEWSKDCQDRTLCPIAEGL